MVYTGPSSTGRLFMRNIDGSGEPIELGSPISFDADYAIDNDIMNYPSEKISISLSDAVTFEARGYINPFAMAAFLGFVRYPSNNYRKRHHMPMRRKSTIERWGGRYL